MALANKKFLKRKDIVEGEILIPVNYSSNVIKIAAMST